MAFSRYEAMAAVERAAVHPDHVRLVEFMMKVLEKGEAATWEVSRSRPEGQAILGWLWPRSPASSSSKSSPSGMSTRTSRF